MISRRGFLPLAGGGLGWSLLRLALPSCAGAAELPMFRAATSAALLADVNVNDARAAMHSWADAVSTVTGMHIDYDRFFFCAPGQLVELMRKSAVHAIGCTTREYLPLAPYVEPNTLLVDITNGLHSYILLVHNESPFRSVADLRGRPLSLYHNQTTCLAMDWLETLLNASKLEPGERFFSTISEIPKLSRTVLPVFFHQADACLVISRGFETMCELNPQLGKALRPIASSPAFLTSIFGFHRDCPAALNAQFRTALMNLTKTATGKQLLSLFQSNALATRDVSVLRSAMTVVESAERIRQRYAAGKS
jgi:ABC-type phosphate/phosphonate transport system substrate-binding protein